MDKNAIKKYAVWARRELISRVSRRAALYGITEKDTGEGNAAGANGHVLSEIERKQRQALTRQIRSKGYEQVMEEVAYTWFNRFCALRFMEVNGYLPSHVRVFTDDENNFKPQILTEAIHLDIDGIDRERVYALKSANDDDELFKYLIITQCNALSDILPGMFRKINDYMELLFPDNLLRAGSVAEQMVALIPQEDWQDAVQIIGWLYQYYNSEKKDDVFAALKKNVKITKENIPAATQLFTPDWIVRYMVENSLGRLWVEGHPNEELKSRWKYYLEEAEQEPEVQEKLAEIRKEYAALNPEDIRCIDPCSGSGHILAYLFDVLVQIYEAHGYTTRDAVRSIVENNLYGLDIDERAAQLANFAVMMKARQYDRRFFSRRIQPKVYAIRESNSIDSYALDYFVNGDAKLKAAMDSIIREMEDAKEYGSILNITPVDFAALYARFEEVRDEIHMSRDVVLNEVLPLVQVAEALARKYDVVVTNPPYMGSSGMGAKLSDFVKKKYPDSKSDLFAVFIERCGEMTAGNGYQAMITQHAWMFLSSYEKLRGKLLLKDIVNMAHLGARAFEEIGGEVVQTTANVQRNSFISNYKGVYKRLVDFSSQKEKEIEFLSPSHCYATNQSSYQKIPGFPIAYWISENTVEAFNNGMFLKDTVTASVGIQTGDNEKFLHFWWEVLHAEINYNAKRMQDSYQAKKWFPYNKGGEFRKWAGNDLTVIDWRNDGENIKNNSQYTGHHYQQYADELKFKPLVTWSRITTGMPAFRIKKAGYLSDMAGFSLYADEKKCKLILAYCNSVIARHYLSFLAPTLNIMVGQVLALPFDISNKRLGGINEIVGDVIHISTLDWDSFETSWDFKSHPLIPMLRVGSETVFIDPQGQLGSLSGSSHKLAACFDAWKKECNARFNQLKANEEELNRIFIDIYGLQEELTPEVADKDVTVHYIADTKEDAPESMRGSNYLRTRQDEIKSLISYAVGCMFGRYSLDVDGLAYAGGQFSDQWLVISGQCYRREVVEKYVSEELQRALGMTEVDGFSNGNLYSGEAASERGISPLSINCKGIQCGAGNTAYDLCSPEILHAIASGNGNELVQRGWEDAQRIDWKAIHYALATNHYAADKDNILPICDDEYFTDDIVGRFVDFVRVVYGADSLEENLRFIADALGGKGQPREVIRSYFLNDFYTDHCKLYQKRPIYWLFDSGKKSGFKALIYMHRYQPDTIARIRTDYVHEQQSRYRTAIADLEQRAAVATTAERVKLSKRLKVLREQAEEIRVYEEKIHHLADQFVSIDLDDGVKVNYAKFQDVLAKIK